MSLKLIIGTKHISSWSLRPWLALKHIGVAFEEILIPLNKPQTRQKILQYSSAGRVPVLIDDSLVIWDSLAICEYLAEKFPSAQLWPENVAMRARARAVSAEMHSGFAHVRQQLSMNLKKKVPLPELNADTQSELNRLQAIWRECLALSGGPFLFGSFTIADAMFAPVVTRFLTYSVPYAPELELYIQAMAHLPAMRQWTSAALIEEN